MSELELTMCKRELREGRAEDHPPVLNDAVQNPFWYCKVLDEGFDLSRFWGEDIALLDELQHL
jgi:hypothetical protein